MILFSRLPIGLAFFVLLVFASLSGCENDRASSSSDTIQYNSDIRPILSDKCFSCHGPDAGRREAGLRLDIREEALAELADSPGKYAIRPGNARKSEVIRRIYHEDLQEVMPPLESTLTLSEAEKALIKQWIQDGATYEPLWSLLSIDDQTPPEARSGSRINNEIDQFIDDRLAAIGIEMAKQAPKEILIRRAAFDLTGLPPTLEEIDAFIADETPAAFERVIDHYLESPAYGERMAADWMDIARYADSDGYLDDKHRDFSPWRDWVITAFNENLPYDEFVSWQVAGDLYPNPSKEQVLATAFNRLHKKNSEAGIVFEEFRVEYVADRTNTFGKAFLGLTMECARCHDHKYDPISQKEYYQLFAFFNNTDEIGHAVYGPDQTPGPALLLTSEEEDEELDRLEKAVNELEEKMLTHRLDTKPVFLEWLSSPLEPEQIEHGIQDARIAFYPFDSLLVEEEHRAVSPQPNDSVPPAVLRDPIIVPGIRGEAFEVSDYNAVVLGENVGWYDRTDAFTIDVFIHPDTLYEDAMLFTHSEEWRLGLRGYTLHLEDNQIVFRMAHSFPQNALQVRGGIKAPVREWTRVTVTYDGSSKASGVAIYLNGLLVPAVIERDNLYKGILFTPDIHTYGFKGIQLGHRDKFTPFKKGRVDEFSVFERALTPLEVHFMHTQELAQQPDYFFEYYLAHEDTTYQRLHDQLKQANDTLNAFQNGIPEIMVMGDRAEPRATHVLDRGMYDAPVEEVAPGTPAAILSFPEEASTNRKGLAQWLFHPDNPLTARVAVNRIWKMHFGQALVATMDDFGNQGALPTHPELLDWLAHTFRESGWDLKALHKRIMMSATYQQDSALTPELFEMDPGNTLYARGASFRLPAEMIRDNALSISGLLVTERKGPSVYPYQPEGLWDELSTKGWRYPYLQEKGEGLYRRSLYTFWKRTSPPPSMLIFDAPDRSTCTVDRQPTSTPLQALVLLNDPQYVEAARKLAERTMLEVPGAPKERLISLFRRITGRYPSADEQALLMEFYQKENDVFTAQPTLVQEYLSNGASSQRAKLDSISVAALAVVANALMNTDEGYTRR